MASIIFIYRNVQNLGEQYLNEAGVNNHNLQKWFKPLISRFFKTPKNALPSATASGLAAGRSEAPVPWL
jgi:hypothetical protein